MAPIVPIWRPTRPYGRALRLGAFIMKDIDRDQQDQEPIGIVISRGTRAEDVPRFWAYVWGPAPATASEVRAAHAA